MARKLRGTDPKQAKQSKPKILVFGAPGVGKTWAALDFPSVYYIDCEGGANLPHYTDKLKRSGGLYLGPQDGANDFATVTEEIITLATTQHKYRTVVIDSYSKIFNTQVALEYQRMEDAKRDMEKTFGAEKKVAINWTRKWLVWFEKLDLNVILICHEKDKWTNGAVTGQTYDGWDKLEYELHLALRVTKQGTSRKAKVTKTRLEGFTDGATFDWSYATFAEMFGRDVIEADAVPVLPVTPEQIAEYQGMLDVIKVDAKVLEKWGAVDLEDLAHDDLQRRIDYLKKLKEGN
jgi:hypothetical protein